MVSHQTFKQWQENPIQGVIPSVPCDSEHLEVVQENLLDALNYLQLSHHYLESSGLSKQYSQLYAAVADSLNSCNVAIESCSDQPDA
jgi:hypothetical protein